MYHAEVAPGLSRKMRSTIDAPTTLVLKVGAPVILTANVSRRLGNGLGGRVMSLEEDHVTVYFQDLLESHQIHQHHFFTFNPKTKSHMFILKQIPLILAYGITIHNSQGMTLHSVSVDCSGCFAAGQIAVAISRVTSSEQLSVHGFSRSLCLPHHPDVNSHYGAPSTPILDTAQCCKDGRKCSTIVVEEIEVNEESDSDGDADDDDVSEDCLRSEEDGSPESHFHYLPHCPFPENLNATSMRERLLVPHPEYPVEVQANTYINAIEDETLLLWSRCLYSKAWDISNSKESLITAFLYGFGDSSEYRTLLMQLFHKNDLDDVHVSIGFRSMLRIIDLLSSAQCKDSATSHQQPQPQKELSPSQRSKLHYVGGMCVGKVVHHYSEYVCSNLHKANNILQCRKSALSALKGHIHNTLSIAEEESDLPETLQEIIYRQTKYGHLTVIDDTMFAIFAEFDSILHKHLTMWNLHENKHDFFKHIFDTSTTEMFLSNEVFIPSHLTRKIMQPVLCKYVKVCLKEFGIRWNMQVAKKISHRKQVMVEEAVESAPKKLCLSTDAITSPQPNPSSPIPSTSSAGQALVIDPVEEPPTICPGCNVMWDDTLPEDSPDRCWIECTKCECWWHRKCDASLRLKRQWVAAGRKNATYLCPRCKELNKPPRRKTRNSRKKVTEHLHVIQEIGQVGHSLVMKTQECNCCTINNTISPLTSSTKRLIKMHVHWHR